VNLESILAALRKILTPSQVCWLCVAASAGVYTYSVKTFASNTEVKAIHVSITESSLFDLRSRQCDAIRRQQSGAALTTLCLNARSYELLLGVAL
jgi:hypothetical protein